jgi:hypothetical protein
MSTATEKMIRQLLEQCMAAAVKEAQQQVSEPLPTQFYVGLDAFGQHGKELSVSEVIPFLYHAWCELATS